MAEGADPKQARAAVGRFALQAETIGEQQFVKGFAHLSGERWPAAFWCTAVDAESGAFMVWKADSGAELSAAVASSCSVPGLFPPITIAGRRFMDGGMRSGTNADLAKGHDRVLILSVMGAIGDAPAPPQGEGDSRLARMRRNAERELSVLRESGARVEVLVPDAEAAAQMGMDLMNPRLAPVAAQAGLRQGRAAADRLRELWS
jgi:NTE family protein